MSIVRAGGCPSELALGVPQRCYERVSRSAEERLVIACPSSLRVGCWFGARECT